MRKIVSLLAVLAVIGALAIWLWPRPHPPKNPEESVTVCKPYTPDGPNAKDVTLHTRSFVDSAVDPVANLAVGPPDQKSYSLGCEKSTDWEFQNNLIIDVEGDDLFIFERGDIREPTRVYVSNDGKNWDEVGTVAGGKSSIELNRKGQTFRFIRLTDLTNPKHPTCKSEDPGADIDAIAAFGYSWISSFSSEVFFATGSFELTSKGKAELDAYFDGIKDQAFSELRVVGHTDTVGDDLSNQVLSENRAIAVADYLIAAGRVEAGKVKSIGMGETQLAKQTPNSTNEPANRRVELIFIPASPCTQPPSN